MRAPTESNRMVKPTRPEHDYRPDIDPARLIQPEEIADIVLFLLAWRGNGVIDEVNIRRPDASYWAAF